MANKKTRKKHAVRRKRSAYPKVKVHKKPKKGGFLGGIFSNRGSSKDSKKKEKHVPQKKRPAPPKVKAKKKPKKGGFLGGIFSNRGSSKDSAKKKDAPRKKSAHPKPKVHKKPKKGGFLGGIFSNRGSSKDSKKKEKHVPQKKRPAPPKVKAKKKPKKGGGFAAEGHLLRVRPFHRIGNALPKSVIKAFDRKLKYAGTRDDARPWLGMRMMASLYVGYLLFFAYGAIYKLSPTPENMVTLVGIWIGGSLFTLLVFYLRLYFAIADRAGQMEKVLPDFLMLMVSNLRAGMTPFASFVRATRPEFGSLHDEVRVSAAATSGNASIADSLSRMEEYFDSRIFKRTIGLFVKGVRSGGQLAKLLRSSADEVQHIQDLRAELETTTKTYTIFLAFINMIIMPFLLSISTLFVKIFLELKPEGVELGPEAVGAIPTFSGRIFITTDQMILVSVITLIITSLLVSALGGVIRKGRAMYGVKQFPLLAIVSVVFFFIALTIVEKMLISFSI